ncbi:flavin reductase [Antarcticimicrobium luteum]|uniref:Flavin reductase n=2 Tax=Antarcticimicrobium luteum TaxID=2547397 RepID=A0A4R5V1L6_9RHOB|nr:flavin reductase [Antarcticimicrobium luteum]
MHSQDFPTLDPMLFRSLIGRFATGVAVILAKDDDRPCGMTVNSLTSVSLDPTLLLFCARNESRSADTVLRVGRFSVNILKRDQTEISNAFSGRGDVASVPLLRDRGFLRLADASAVFLCDLHEVFPGGDHRIILGRPVHMEAPEGQVDPLLFIGGQYAQLPKPPTDRLTC